jgi:hypothetical protein
MINLACRKSALHIEKSEPVCAPVFVGDHDCDVAVVVFAASYIGDFDAVCGPYFPRKNPALRAVIENGHKKFFSDYCFPISWPDTHD